MQRVLLSSLLRTLPRTTPAYRQLRNPFTLPDKSTTSSYQKRTMSLSYVSTQNAPSAVGPYSQAVKAGNLVFVSGCIPLNPTTMKVEAQDIEGQAKQALANLKAVVEASGSTTNKVVKTTVFLKNMDDFAAANKIYSEFFGEHKPARSCVEVARLPLGVLFEAECIALVD